MYVDPKIKNAYRVPQPEGRGQFLRLDQNENPDGVPQWLFDEVVQKISPSFLSIYPEESALTEKYAKLFNLSPRNVSLTDGSVVGMGYIIKIFGEPSKKLVSVTPTFGMYKVYAEMSGLVPKMIPYADDHSFDIKCILNEIDEDTSIVVLVNPNMPIGNVYSSEEIESVVKKAHEYNAVVIIDEAYYYFTESNSIDLVKKYDNVFILRTFSKMLSIPALRLGAIISSEENIHYVENYKPHYTVNSIALLFGSAIVDNHEKIVSELKSSYQSGRQYLYDSLYENKYSFLESGGCFVCIRPKNRSSEELTQLLRENGILILCGTGDLSGYIRVSVCGVKYMRIFMKALLELDSA